MSTFNAIPNVLMAVSLFVAVMMINSGETVGRFPVWVVIAIPLGIAGFGLFFSLVFG